MQYRSAAVLLAVAVLAACDGNSVTDATPWQTQADYLTQTQTVEGRMTITNPSASAITDSYFFVVRQYGATVAGYFEYQTTLLAGPARVSGRVTCVTRVGNKARLGGVIQTSTNPALPVGSQLTWSVTDAGDNKNAPDTGSSFLGADAELYCRLGLPYPENPGQRKSYIEMNPATAP